MASSSSIIAKALVETVLNGPHFPICDCSSRAPGLNVIGDFFLQNTLPVTKRPRLSHIEVCFILLQYGKFVWPINYDEACDTLSDLVEFMLRVRFTNRAWWLWNNGFVFFGTTEMIPKILKQLHLREHTNLCRVMLTAGPSFFIPTTTTHCRKTGNLTCNVRLTDAWVTVKISTIPRLHVTHVVCACAPHAVHLEGLLKWM